MNKLIIILLAVCLVSVHAFVKRDAPEPTGSPIVKDITDQLENIQKKLQETFDPETIKKGFSDALNTVSQALESMKPTEAPKP